MRSSIRLLARVKPGQFLEAYAPTGLTGIVTHPSPRPALITTYTEILEKLKAAPETSVYRQSTEALTKHRLKIVEEIKPAGFDEWLERARKRVTQNPKAYEPFRQPDGSYKHVESYNSGKSRAWDGEERTPDLTAVTGSEEVIASMNKKLERAQKAEEDGIAEWESEPALDSTQINEMEEKIGAGLIEEVILVATGELKLVDEMLKTQVWDELEERPATGQWDYFERGTHTGTT